MGLPLLFHAWWTLLFAAIVLPLAFYRRIVHEERLLRRDLTGYAEYASTCKALIPGIL
jgi:protein-S-isoprenylcysteine O-methyltransferase Ste14